MSEMTIRIDDDGEVVTGHEPFAGSPYPPPKTRPPGLQGRIVDVGDSYTNGPPGEVELLSDELRNAPTRAELMRAQCEIARLRVELRQARQAEHDKAMAARRMFAEVSHELEDLQRIVEEVLYSDDSRAVCVGRTLYEAWKERQA